MDSKLKLDRELRLRVVAFVVAAVVAVIVEMEATTMMMKNQTKSLSWPEEFLAEIVKDWSNLLARVSLMEYRIRSPRVFVSLET